MKVYKSNLTTDIFFKIGSVLLLGLIILLSKKFLVSYWPLLIIFLVLLLTLMFIFSRLIEIQIDGLQKNIILIYKKYVFLKKSIKYDLSQIEFTYKYKAISLRSSPKNVCTLYFADKDIAQLIPNQDGWSDDEIGNFVSELINLGIKRKLVGYNLKDITP